MAKTVRHFSGANCLGLALLLPNDQPLQHFRSQLNPCNFTDLADGEVIRPYGLDSNHLPGLRKINGHQRPLPFYDCARNL
jgi:hypothetical protein